MASRKFEITAPARAEATPNRETADKAVAGGRVPGAAFGTGGDPGAQAAALAHATGGRLARAGAALLQLQQGYGNRHVQQVANHARQAGSVAQRERELDKVEPLQGRFDSTGTQAAAPNRTGMPDQLKAGIEALSGMDLSDVRVHTNSGKPAQLNALAYAQGRDIYLASGQEHHLPHEAWHVVQQAQGRVRPTLQLKAGVAVNDDAGLEHEADVMGTKGSQMTPVGPSTPLSHKRISAQSKPGAPRGPVGQDAQEALPVVQRSILKDEPLKHRFAGTTRGLADQIELDRSADYYHNKGWGKIIILGSDEKVETDKSLAIVAHGSAKGEFSSYKTGQALAVAVVNHHGVIPGMKIALEGCYSEAVIEEFGNTIDNSPLNEPRKFTTVAGNIGVQFDVDQKQYAISEEEQENKSQQEYISYRDEKLKAPESIAIEVFQKVAKQLPEFQENEAEYILQNMLFTAAPAQGGMQDYTSLGDWLSKHQFDGSKFAAKEPKVIAGKLKKTFNAVAKSSNVKVWGELIKALHDTSVADLDRTPVLNEFRAGLLAAYEGYREAVGSQVQAHMQALKPYSDQERAGQGSIDRGRLRPKPRDARGY